MVVDWDERDVWIGSAKPLVHEDRLALADIERDSDGDGLNDLLKLEIGDDRHGASGEWPKMDACLDSPHVHGIYDCCARSQRDGALPDALIADENPHAARFDGAELRELSWRNKYLAKERAVTLRSAGSDVL